MGKLLRLKDAAKKLGVNPRTLRTWVYRGVVPVYKDRVSGRLYFSTDDLESLKFERRLTHKPRTGTEC